MSSLNVYRNLLFLCIVLLITGCKKNDPDTYEWKSLTVTATAYNSVKSQTDGDPNITAFGDSLYPGLKCIAVSRDLLKLGLVHNTLVKIEGLEGTYLVKDKMHKRWRNRIDIYMGTDVNTAKEWGKKRVKIDYRVLKVVDSTSQ